MRKLLRYTFVPFIPIVAYLQDQFGIDEIVDDTILVAVGASIAIYALTPKTIFRVIYFNYLVIWFCLGTIGYIVHRILWFGWQGEILEYNRLCAIFLFVYSLSAYLLGLRIRPGVIKPIARNSLDPGLATSIPVVMIVLFAVFVLPAVGWTGVFSGGLNDDNRFTVETNALVPRLSLAFPFLMCVFVDRLSRNDLRLTRFVVFLLVSFYLMSVMGARFGFFQVLITGFMFLLFTGNLELIRRYRKTVLSCLALLVAVQLIMPALRVGSGIEQKSDNFSSSATFLGSLAGEHKDAAASLRLLSSSDRDAIAENYVPSLVYPLVPAPILSAAGFDKNEALSGGAAYYMQKAYNVQGEATIRVGGIAEAYFFLGLLGVVVAGLANAWVAAAIDRVVYATTPKTFRAVSFAAYGSVWLFYFVASQSNMLLGGFAAFVVTYFVIWYAGSNRRATSQVPAEAQ